MVALASVGGGWLRVGCGWGRLREVYPADAPPRLHDDESFALWVNASGARLRVAGFAGVQRGLEAFAQVDLS